MIPEAVLRRPDLIDDDDIDFIEGTATAGRNSALDANRAARLLEKMIVIRERLLPDGPFPGMDIAQSLTHEARGGRFA